MAWLYVDYEPVAAFGLRPSNTTSNGGKSLICPTPYAVKMALLDRIIRQRGVEWAEPTFDSLRDMPIYVRLPLAAAVNRTFQKILRTPDPKTGKWTETISQREYVFFAGLLTLALPAPADEQVQALWKEGFMAINYFGRRGGFMQMMACRLVDHEPTADQGFTNASQSSNGLAMIGGFLQRMDDFSPDAHFADVSLFNPSAKGGRRSYTVIFPYAMEHYGANHVVYAQARK